MGCYRKKAYKKIPVDPFHEKGLKERIMEEVDSFYVDGEEKENNIFEEEYPPHDG